MRFVLTLLMCAWAVWGVTACGEKASADQTEGTQRPNIIVVLVDDMGFSDLGFCGSGIQTPHLDQLAQEGVLFRNFYNTGRCCPTRAVLMTGQYNHRVGVGHMTGDYGLPGYRGFLSDQVPTVAELLQAGGYQTLMVGKWHLGNDPGRWPMQRGFERFYGVPEGGGVYFYPFQKERNVVLDGQRLQPDSSFYSTTAFSEHAVRFVQDAAADERPFFMYLAHIAPHFPLQAPDSTVARYAGQFRQDFQLQRSRRLQALKQAGLIAETTPLAPYDSLVPTWDQLDAAVQDSVAHEMAVYAAQLDLLDQGIGQLVHALRETGQADNTAILFMSDNGASPEEMSHRYPDLTGPVGSRESYHAYGREWAHVSNTPFQYFKSYTYEGGIATPLIAHWPSQWGDHRVEQQVAHAVDVVPTVLQLAGVEYPDSLPLLAGRPLAPWLAQRQDTVSRTLFWEHEGDRAVRRGNWKLASIYPENQWRLYDLAQDPVETEDLSRQHPQKKQQLEALYAQWAAANQVMAWDSVRANR